MADKTSSESTKAGNKRDGANPVLLSRGNPQIAKADGDVPVQTYITAMPGWKSDVGRRLDDLIVRSLPEAHKGARWNSPFYGVEGKGWFLSYHVFTRYVKATFFQGALLQRIPPGAGKERNSRWTDIYGVGLDEERVIKWVRQAGRHARLAWVRQVANLIRHRSNGLLSNFPPRVVSPVGSML